MAVSQTNLICHLPHCQSLEAPSVSDDSWEDALDAFMPAFANKTADLRNFPYKTSWQLVGTHQEQTILSVGFASTIHGGRVLRFTACGRAHARGGGTGAGAARLAASVKIIDGELKLVQYYSSLSRIYQPIRLLIIKGSASSQHGAVSTISSRRSPRRRRSSAGALKDIIKLIRSVICDVFGNA